MEAIGADTYAISEYDHWDEPHCYLLNGDRASLLIDTGLGVGQIAAVAAGLAGEMAAAFARLNARGLLRRGAGRFAFDGWSVRL